MPLTDNDIAELLAPAGLIFIERITEPPSYPLPPDLGPANCRPEHGRFDSEQIDVYDADMAERIDADWWRMATSYGLLDEH